MSMEQFKALLPGAPIYQIAVTIEDAWPHPYFGAKPYLNAMRSMAKITNPYFQDPGPEIVAKFLANASTWRGETARAVKKELNRRLKENEMEGKET